jgi:hypothetical protein
MGKRSLEKRFWAKVDKGDGTGCWLWTGTRWAKGYGQVRHQNRRLLAHRVAYELLVGPIPDGYQIDHLCRVTRCVRPDHLEPVTPLENARRAAAFITHCPSGHPYDEVNTRRTTDGRHCKACNRERWQTSGLAARRRAQRAARRSGSVKPPDSPPPA